jgi:putative ABC transport system permease protein
MIKENISISINSIKSNPGRAILTMLIISIGIMALVGILTAIDAIKDSISSNFSSLGANTFTIRNRELLVRIGNSGRKPKKYKAINFEEAQLFKNKLNTGAKVSISIFTRQDGLLKFENIKTNPNNTIVGSDENYLTTSALEIEKGRNFTIQEVNSAKNVCILGNEINYKLFKNRNSVGKSVYISGLKYRIVGMLKSKGSGMGVSADKMVIIPINNARNNFLNIKIPSYTVNVACNSTQHLNSTLLEAIGTFRVIRKLRAGTENNFEIIKSDSLSTMLISNLSLVTVAATIIGFITLLGAAIGLLNIMLVSVTERTREIGIRKSLGATQKKIQYQFLTEAVVICQAGGILGIIFGIIIGNLVSFAVGNGFTIPYFWMSLGLVICFVVGVSSGIYPAIKASKLDPIESLRFE